MLALSEVTESLAHRVAAVQKLSVDAAVRHAPRQQALLAGVAKFAAAGRVCDEEIARRMAATRDIQDKIAALPILDPRPIEEIFDEVNEEIFDEADRM